MQIVLSSVISDSNWDMLSKFGIGSLTYLQLRVESLGVRSVFPIGGSQESRHCICPSTIRRSSFLRA